MKVTKQTVPHSQRTDIGAESVRGFKLVVLEGPAEGTEWSASSDACSIGSHELCDLSIDDRTVSRFHCEIRMDSGGVRVRDSGSSNGTLLDGVRVMDGFLRGSSTIRLGRTLIRFELIAQSNQLQLSDSDKFGSLTGNSVLMRRTFSLLERAAKAEATTLLEGETGTGKSAAARAIHAHSKRSSGPFVMLDCGAIPPNLIESELFGHAKGAFTGADSARIGAFEEADGGTLFLDEIGELSPALQPKLLGALENRVVRRVGGTGSTAVNVRVVAATNRDLRREINEGQFRSDLYFRLAVIRIEMPNLRSRPEDIPAIARSLLVSLGADEKTSDPLSGELLEQLGRSAWPGNVRELKNYLERCLVFDEVLPVDGAESSAGPSPVDIDLSFADAKKRAVADFERAYLTKVLEHHGGTVVDAAAAAKIDRTHFYRLLRRHRLKTD